MIKETDTIAWRVLLEDLQKRRNMYANWSKMGHNPPETQKTYAALSKEMQNLIDAIPDYIRESKR